VTATLREHAQRIVRAAVAAVDPERLIRDSLGLEGSRLTLRGTPAVLLPEAGGVRLLAAGKAAPAMAASAAAILGPRLLGGSVAAPPGHAPPIGGLEVWEAGHPVPTIHSVAAAASALWEARSAGPNDLLLCLLSGGASALWTAPEAGLTLDDLRLTTTALLRAGAPIAEVNTVRKHLSRIAGGRLARTAAPARVLTLAVSDVIGTGEDSIGSGPTLPDPSTFADSLTILRERDVRVPTAVIAHLEAGVAGRVGETPKPGDLDNLAGFHVLASIDEALEGARAEAERQGYQVEIVSARTEGEAREVGTEVARRARHDRDAGRRRVALLWGGETTVTVKGDGRGGRNQEVALAAALTLEGLAGIAVGSVGTDGIDGPTDAAGALVDGGTVARGREAGLEPAAALARNDAYPFLCAAGDLLFTGPTGTNVNDVCVALIA
jgi:glycerate 2-kinase